MNGCPNCNQNLSIILLTRSVQGVVVAKQSFWGFYKYALFKLPKTPNQMDPLIHN